MKYTEYCPECYEDNVKSKLLKTDSALDCPQCAWSTWKFPIKAGVKQ